MNKYVSYFSGNITGLTGSAEMIDRVVEQFGVHVEKEQPKQNDGMYAVDHTASLFLMAPDGSFVTKFAYGIESSTLAQELKSIVH
jgi:protein SCO1/2